MLRIGSECASTSRYCVRCYALYGIAHIVAGPFRRGTLHDNLFGRSNGKALDLFFFSLLPALHSSVVRHSRVGSSA